MNYPGRMIVATIVSAAFLWALTLGVSPALHTVVHSDAARSEHTCGATLIGSGGYENPAPLSPIDRPSGRNSFTRIPPFFPSPVASVFLDARVLEHAPPTSA